MTQGMQSISEPSSPGTSIERRHSPDAVDLPLNLHEYETAARAVLPAMSFDYIAGGACDEVTLRSNRLAFDRWRLLPRVLRGGTSALDTSVLGQADAG
jgi:hypothetical protein